MEMYNAQKLKIRVKTQLAANDRSDVFHLFHLNFIASHKVLLNLLNSYQSVENIEIL
jgi:hypothetical protein